MPNLKKTGGTKHYNDMKKADIQIEVKAFVNGKEVPCELSTESKIIIMGDLTINNVQLEPK